MRLMVVALPLLCLSATSTAWSAAAAPAIGNDQTRIEALGEPGKWTGVVVSAAGQEVTRVELSSGGRWTAARAGTGKGGTTLSLEGLSTLGAGGTPTLGPSSFVRFTLRRGDPFPRVDFRLDITEFDCEKWQRAWSAACPMYFLRCSVPDAEFYYFHGLLAPTPKTDPYPFSWQDMRAGWADGWSTAPAIAALTVPAVALWTPSTGRLVAYSFQHARSTDRSDKHLSVAYCWGTPDHPGQFFALLAPYQRGWNELTYPTAPTTVESHFDLLYDLKTGPRDDVNRFVFDHLWARYRDLLPSVPRINDLGWMVERNGFDEGAPAPSVFSRVHKADRSFASQFFKEDTQVFGGDFRAVDLAFRRGDEQALARFREEAEVMLSRALWETVDGEECCYWRYPSEGGWDEWIGGARADTTHNVQQFGFAGALLAWHLNEPSDRLWRHVEGCYRWARHYVYTRGDICDIPCSMFTLQTSQLAMNFLMNLHYAFRESEDAGKREMAEEAFRLAYTVVWRNANVTTDDPDEGDALDPSFLMPGNHARFWLGQVSWAELCDVFRSMIVMYVETGDPRFRYYVRGALDRWYTGFQSDGYHTDENLDVFGQTAGVGVRTGVHGPQDSFWEWAQPVGEAVLRVTAGRAGAMAFRRGDSSLDITDYRFRPPASFAFRITGSSDKPFRMIFSSPFRDLSGLPVVVHLKAGEEPPATPAEGEADVQALGPYHEHLLFTAQAGATVEIGEVGRAPVAMRQEPPPKPPRSRPRWWDWKGLKVLNVGRYANTALDRSWERRDSWAGLPFGRAFACGVPFELADPDAANGRIAVQEATVPVLQRAAAAFLLASGLGGEGKVELVLSSGEVKPVDPDAHLLARTGRPLQAWDLWLYPVRLPDNIDLDAVRVQGEARLFALAIEPLGHAVSDQVLARLKAAQEQETAAREAEGRRGRMVLRCRDRVRAVLDRKLVRGGFLPPHGPPAPDIRAALDALGLPSIALRPEEIIDPALFSAADYPILVYTSAEHYLRTVRQPGDGDRALLRYLREGGTLLVMGACRPFTYADDVTQPVTSGPGEWALFGREFGLDLLGPGEERGGAAGFEQPPARPLVLRAEPGQLILTGLPPDIPFPSTGDRRYRPATGTLLPPDDEFQPILTAYDDTGKAYGPAMAVIRRHAPPYAHASILWVWGTLLSKNFTYADSVLYQSLAAAAEMCAPASPSPAVVASPEAALGATVGLLPLAQKERADLVKRLCREMNADCLDVPPDVFVEPLAFAPERFPVAVHAAGEQYVRTWRLPEDGSEAYLRYLREGGFLIVCGNATQFWYPTDYVGDGWQSFHPVEPTMPRAIGLPMVQGFETPTGAMKLALVPGQSVITGLDRVTDVTSITDPRWRGLIPTRGADLEFTPLAYLTDGEGNRYNGCAAALIRRKNPGHRPGAILHLWGNLIEGEAGEALLRSALQFALKDVQRVP